MLGAEYAVSMVRNQSMLQPTHARRWRQDRDPRRFWTTPHLLAGLLGEFNWHMQR